MYSEVGQTGDSSKGGKNISLTPDKTIRKEDIGKPTNFEHLAHVSLDEANLSMVNSGVSICKSMFD